MDWKLDLTTVWNWNAQKIPGRQKFHWQQRKKGGFTDKDRQSGRSMKHLRNWVPPYGSEICVSGFTCLCAAMTLLSRMLSVMSVLFIETTETPAKVNESSYVT